MVDRCAAPSKDDSVVKTARPVKRRELNRLPPAFPSSTHPVPRGPVVPAHVMGGHAGDLHAGLRWTTAR